MRLNTISVVVALSASMMAVMIPTVANSHEIMPYEVKDVVKKPNTRNLEFAVKQHVELEAKLLQWHLTEPLRKTRRLSLAAMRLPSINHLPSAPPAKTDDEKAAEWKIIECERWGRCE